MPSVSVYLSHQLCVGQAEHYVSGEADLDICWVEFLMMWVFPPLIKYKTFSTISEIKVSHQEVEGAGCRPACQQRDELSFWIHVHP